VTHTAHSLIAAGSVLFAVFFVTALAGAGRLDKLLANFVTVTVLSDFLQVTGLLYKCLHFFREIIWLFPNDTFCMRVAKVAVRDEAVYG
jgi:hypothetical protein